MIIKFFYRSFWWKSWYIYFFHLINQKLTINNTHYCFISLSYLSLYLSPLPGGVFLTRTWQEKKKQRESFAYFTVLPSQLKTANTVYFFLLVCLSREKKTRLVVLAENKWSRLEGTLSVSPVLAASARSPPPMR